jgi:hypothetical protein
MELSIKNENLTAHFQAEENSPLNQNMPINKTTPYSNEASKKWAEDHPEAMCYGFLSSFLEISEMRGIELDLTYNTFKNVCAGLGALFAFQKKHYDHYANVDIVAKTLASYLSYLAINEHNYWFRTTCYLAQVKAGKPPKQPLWAGVDSIAVGKKNKYVDFLPCCKDAVKPGSIMIPGGLTIQIDPIIAEYKKLTGVDLTEYGFSNLFIG